MDPHAVVEGGRRQPVANGGQLFSSSQNMWQAACWAAAASQELAQRPPTPTLWSCFLGACSGRTAVGPPSWKGNHGHPSSSNKLLQSMTPRGCPVLPSSPVHWSRGAEPVTQLRRAVGNHSAGLGTEQPVWAVLRRGPCGLPFLSVPGPVLLTSASGCPPFWGSY